MKILESFVRSPFAGTIGWTLLHSLWEGAAIAALLATVVLATRSARVRYAAACMAMIAMVVAFAVTTYRMMPESAQTFPRFRAVAPFTMLPNVAGPADRGPSWIEIISMLVPWLPPFWIGGVLLLSLQRVTSCVAVRRLRSRGVCFASEEWHAELARLAVQLGVSRPVHLLESCFAEIPMVLGHLRPVILVPIGLLANLPPGQVETILLHELAHIRRCDYLVNALQRLVESVLFYHPAIWWISKVMRIERENCCDDVVVSVSRHASEYARALAALERNRLPHQRVAVAATGGTLVKRIRRLLYPKAPAGTWAPVAATTIFVVTAAVSFAAWQPKSMQSVSVKALTQAPGTNNVQVKTFYLPNSELSAPMDTIVSALRQVLNSKRVEAVYAKKAIIVRDTPEKLSVAGKIIDAEDNQTISSNPAASDHAAQLRLQLKTLENLVAQRRLTDAQELRNAIVVENSDATQGVQNETTEIGPYLKWLDEDVADIIMPEERDTFLHLDTDEQRDQFIKAFWERRNPTPGAADNKFKDEHYRRITYANEHFAGPSGTPGWKTDRGRIYITWGRPDQREEHVAGEMTNRPVDQGGGSTATYAYEDWWYRDITGINGGREENVEFEFVDPNGAGDFYLTMNPSEKYVEAISGQAARQSGAAPSAPGVVPQLKPLSRARISIAATEDSRTIYQTIASLGGLRVEFDPSFTSHRIKVNLSGVSLEQALNAVSMESGNKWTAIAADKFVVAAAHAQGATTAQADKTAEDLREGIVRRLPLPSGTTASTANRIVAQLLLQYGPGHAEYDATQNVIIVRGSPDEVRAVAGQVIDLAGRAPTKALPTPTSGDHQRPETIDIHSEVGGRGGSLDITAPETYSKWLNEDVVYIISDQERDTFLHLNTDEEREKFIEAFWERRNPTPGSADNKFKEEHYRRVAYSNEHFATPSGKAGWQTDRGHIYIVYGVPDARDHFTAGQNGSQFASEQWHYKHIDGVGDNLMFEFVDRSGNGDFVLVPSPSNGQVVPKTEPSNAAIAGPPNENLYRGDPIENSYLRSLRQPPASGAQLHDSTLEPLFVRVSSPSNQGAPSPNASNTSAENDEYAKEGVTILSSTEGVDFSPYIKDMLKSIYGHWLSEMPQEAKEGRKGQVSVIFSIRPDGKLLYWQIPSSSGVQSFDEAARDAVRGSSPLQPLPSQFHGPYLKLKLTFTYNQPLHS